MANEYRRTIVLGIDHSEFTGGVTEANRAMKMLDAEFKLATEQAKGMGDETEQLRIKQEMLSAKIEIQNKLVEEAAEAYERAKESGEATEKQTDNLRRRMLEQMTTLQRMNNELQDTEEQLDDTTDSQKSFGDTIRGISSFLGIEASPAVQAFAEKFEGVSEEAGKAAMEAAGFAAVSGAIVSKMIEASKGVAEYADNLITLSSVTGVHTDRLQEMQYAADFVDVSMEEMTNGMKTLNNVMGQAVDGSEDMHKIFVRLGVKYKDNNGQLRDVESTYYDVIDALGKIGNEANRDAQAMKIFGESAKNMNPLIEAGSQSLKDLGKEARELGYVLSSEDLAKAGALDDSLRRMDASSIALKNNLGLVLVPVLTGFFNALSQIPIPVLTMLITTIAALTGLVAIVKAITAVTQSVKGISSVFTEFNPKAMKTTAIVLGVVAALIALATIIAVIMGKSNDLSKSMNSIGGSIGQVTESVTGAQNQTQKQKYNATGTDFFEGGETWVGEHGAEKVVLPRGSKITPANQAGGGETNNYYFTVEAKNIKELNDLVNIANQKKTAIRRGLAVT